MNALFDRLPARVTVCEVGPRDGLQNEPSALATEDKLRYIELLAAAGFPQLEVTSFVSPKAVPQLADADTVFPRVASSATRRDIALVPNERGLDRALRARVRNIAVFTAASDAFAQRNIGMTIDESLEAFAVVVARAKNEGLWVRASVSTSFGCPFAGAVAPSDVVRVACALRDLGVDELSIADTIGVATPNAVATVVAALAERIALSQIGLHFHDTRGTALANVVAGLQSGVAIYDASAGGLGGCPFAPGATGNLATEDLLYLLDGMHIETGIDPGALRAATRFIDERLPGRVVSRAFRALEAADARAACA